MPPQQPAGFVPDGFVPDQPTAPPPTPKGHDFKVFGVNIHVPSEEKPRLDSNMVGWGSNGAGVAPEDALMAGQAVRGVAKAAASGGALAGAKTALAEAAPVAKYEIAHHVLKYAGFPDALAIPVAIAISGYRKGAKAVEGEAGMVAPPKDMNAPHLDRSIPVQPSSLTPQQLAERMQYGHGTPTKGPSFQDVHNKRMAQLLPDIPPADGRVPTGYGTQPNNILDEVPTGAAAPGSVSGGTAPPSGPLPSAVQAGSPAPPATAANYPQKFLNEAAIQARRQGVTLTDADYAAARELTQQGKTAAEAVALVHPPDVPTPPVSAPKPRMTSEQSSLYMRLRASGKTDEEAKVAIEAAQAMSDRYALKTPTIAETKFPKGMRGKANPPAVPPR